MAKANRVYDWPLLDVVNPKGESVGGNLFTWPVVSTGRTLAGPVRRRRHAAVLRVHTRVTVAERAATVRELRRAVATVSSEPSR
ncbi:hypothetical protein [Streptomyces sp. Ag109_O5-10]|uniref:hypothetical protein n=1 Tax=Streptomyces sp. Ag109_O5-10 TaxID=1855349 RepID=UPI00089473FE|nr:hypothetical protein [Streptomyces sp. Ag109_O5-10]SEF01381.1 lactate permease [Streptomyces sp. Ag109_O5-10]